MINGISHVAIMVSDFEKSVDFYRNLLGFSSSRFLELPNGRKIAFLARPGHDQGGQYEVELFGNPSNAAIPEGAGSSSAVGIRHVALVVDDIDEVYTNLREKGVNFINEPRIPAPDLPKICSLRDPDGISIELVQFMST